MRSLSILMVTPRYEPSIGGVETHVREIGSRLAERGHRVAIVAADPDHVLPERGGSPALPLLRVRTWPRGSDAMLAPGLPAAMGELQPEIVHVQSYHTLMAPLALAIARAAGRPSVLTFHSGGHSSGVRRAARGLQLLALRPLLRGARALVAVSAFERDVLAARLRLRRSRFTVIPNGADLPSVQNGTAEDIDLIVSLGRLEAYKGHDQVIRALPDLRRRRPATRLRIAGTGPDEARLRRLADRLGVLDVVTIAPVQSNDRTAMATLLAQAGAVTVLSSYESQGIAATEAVGVGARVVAADASALAELVARGLATGVPQGASAATLAADLDRVLAGPRPAPAKVPSWDEAAERLEALYRRIVDDAAG